MKKSSILALAAAGLLLTACAEREEIALEVDNPQSEVLPEGYMSLSINLPTTPSTRAVNDDFADGESYEYKVNNCALLLFEGDNESDATLFRAQKITLTDEDDDATNDGDNITTSYLATASVKGRTTTGGKLYALVLLNYDGVLTSISTDALPQFEGDNTPLDKEAKLSTLRNKIIKNNTLTGRSTNNFFMTNAILSDKPGGANDPTGANIFQLAELDPTKVFDTEEKAKANPAGDIFVERAVAKATMSVSSGIDNTVSGLTISKIEWCIDNMQPETYIFRNPGTNEYIGYQNVKNNNYRFVGSASVNTNASSSNPNANDHDHGIAKAAYRTYWCIDPMYSEAAPAKGDEGYETANYMLSYSENDFKQIYPSTGINPTPFYCYENTFNVAQQSYRNTTRAIIKVTFSTSDNGNEIYTVNGSSTPVTETTARNQVLSYIITNTEVQDAFKNQLVTNKETLTYTINESSFNVTFERTSTGQYAVKTLTLSSDAETAINGSADFQSGAADEINNSLKALIDNINKGIVIFNYKDGIMYYEARFQHFAGSGSSDLAPWNAGEYGTTAPAGGSTANAYPANGNTTAEMNYLGRYGMVRNNWYDVEVTAITGLGYPEVPSVTVENPGYDDPDTPDDNLKENIAVKIHVLSWAKRKQQWGF